jgi:hypothetical protein
VQKRTTFCRWSYFRTRDDPESFLVTNVDLANQKKSKIKSVAIVVVEYFHFPIAVVSYNPASSDVIKESGCNHFVY